MKISRERIELWFTILVSMTCLILMSKALFELGLIISLVYGLTLTRAFVLFHDHVHRSSYRHPTDMPLMWLYGIYTGSPLKRWRRTHLEHHRFTQLPGWESPGGIPILEYAQFQASSFIERLGYRLMRSPLLIILAYPVNLYFNTLHDPKKDRQELIEGVVCVLFHVTMHFVALSISVKFWILFVLIPFTISWALGTALFYVQHNFPDSVPGTDNPVEWSSHLVLPAFCEWWIGYINHHHTHHIRPGIAFYELKHFAGWEAGEVKQVTLKEVPGCFKLKFWDQANSKWTTTWNS